MSGPVLIDVHGDDCALFASFLALRYKPLVLVTHCAIPEEEIDDAMFCLGCRWERRSLYALDLENTPVVIAPAWLKDGLPEHNLVAEAVQDADAIRYLTYAGYPRWKARSPHESEFERDWIWRKLRALSAYQSQAETPSYIHFLEDLREYIL